MYIYKKKNTVEKLCIIGFYILANYKSIKIHHRIITDIASAFFYEDAYRYSIPETIFGRFFNASKLIFQIIFTATKLKKKVM